MFIFFCKQIVKEGLWLLLLINKMLKYLGTKTSTFCISASGLPSVFLKSQPEGSSDNHYQRLALFLHEDLNLPGNPCNDQPDYSFRACVTRKVSEEVANTPYCHIVDKASPLKRLGAGGNGTFSVTRVCPSALTFNSSGCMIFICISV